MHQGFRCEDIEAQTFGGASFDLVITQDVMEHVFRPDQAHKEIYRTLRPGGLHIHTVPIYYDMEHTKRCSKLIDDGRVIHLSEPEYHGNPVNDLGALVTYRYGRDLPDMISEWAPFSIEVIRFNDRHHGVVGAFTDVVVCQKIEVDYTKLEGQCEERTRNGGDLFRAQEELAAATLAEEYKELSQENQKLQLSFANVINSRSWRLTEPLRRVMRLLRDN